MHNNFKELNVWKESKDLCLKVYKATQSFPKSELYGLTSQLNRAVISIPSNIAEGSGRETNKDFSRFINIALGSSFEVETQLIIAFELNILNESDYQKLIEQLNQIQKMLHSFNKHLKSKF